MVHLADDREWRTFEEWRELRCWVRKGEKATWFDDVPKFSLYQVKEDLDWITYGPCSKDEMYMDSLYDWYDKY